MNQPVAPDTTPPSAPGTLTADGGIGAATLELGPRKRRHGGHAVQRVPLDDVRVHAKCLEPDRPCSRPRDRLRGRPGRRDLLLQGDGDGPRGERGPSSNEAPATVTPDAAPTVDVTSPSGGSTLSGTVTVTASATDDVHVAGVQFKLDGQNLGHEVTASPYAVTWDTRAELNGGHTFTAVARDVNGQTTTSAPVAVTFANAGVSADTAAGRLRLRRRRRRRRARHLAEQETTRRLGGRGLERRRPLRRRAVARRAAAATPTCRALGTFYKTAFTLEAWVPRRRQRRTSPSSAAGPAPGTAGRCSGSTTRAADYDLTLGASPRPISTRARNRRSAAGSTSPPPTTARSRRIYIDGVVVASSAFTGNVGNSNTWRIGAYGDTPPASSTA